MYRCMMGQSSAVAIVIALVAGGILFLVYYVANIAHQEKKKVAMMDRRPMVLCDIHGAYPKEASLYINVPADGRPDMRQEMCPFCYRERLEKAKEIASGR